MRSATTTSSPSCCASSCGGRPRRSSPRCTGRRRAGTSSTARPVEAIRHAQAAGDWPYAARLLADGAVSLVFDGRTATLLALHHRLPARRARHRRGARARLRQGPALRGCARRERHVHRRRSAAGRRRRPPSAGGASTCSCRRPSWRSRVAAGTSAPRWRRCGPWRSARGAAARRAGAEQRPAGRRADGPRDRGAVVLPARRRAPPPATGARARAADRTAVPADRLPRATSRWRLRWPGCAPRSRASSQSRRS